MRKTKLLMAACALMFGVSAGWAYEDVTSTYLKNADLSLDPQTTGSDDAAMIRMDTVKQLASRLPKSF